LNQNYPNPFNAHTKISFTIPYRTFVNLTIYNLLGQAVKTLVNDELDAGTHNVDFDAQDFASGIYIYKISTKNFSPTKKMILLK